MKYLSRFVVACLMVLLAGTSSAPATDNLESWLRLDTAHFTFFSARDEAETRALGRDLEGLRDTLAQLFPLAKVDFPVPTYLYVFRDGEHFGPYRSPGGGMSLGYFVPHIHANYAALNGNPAVNPTVVVYQQYISALLNANLPLLPPWFSQGLSSYYSTFTIEETEARIGLPVKNFLNLLNTNDPEKRMPFATLLAMDSVPRTNELAIRYLPQSWGLVHYLLSDEATREKVPRLVEALAKGAPSAQALEEVFGLTTTALDAAIHTYLTGESFTYLKVRVPPATKDTGRIRAVPPALTSFHLGDLLSHLKPRNETQARKHFMETLAIEPEHGPAHAGLGGLLEPASAEARTHYARAAELAPDDFLVHYLYGESLLAALGNRRPRDDDEKKLVAQAATAFRQSTSLRPDYAEAWARLGYALGLAGTDANEAVEALERALHGLPARHDVAFNLLLAYARAGRRESADAIVARLARTGTEAEKQRASEVLMQMDYNTVDQLVRAHKLDDAVAVLVRVQAESSSEMLRTRAAKKFTLIEPAAQHNQFATQYLDAVARWRSDDAPGARVLLETLAEEARPGKQIEAVQILLDKLDEP